MISCNTLISSSYIAFPQVGHPLQQRFPNGDGRQPSTRSPREARRAVEDIRGPRGSTANKNSSALPASAEGC